MTHAWFSAEDREPLHESRGRPFKWDAPRQERAEHRCILPREAQAVKLVQAGLTTTQAAIRMGVARNTVWRLVKKAEAKMARGVT